MQHRAHYMQTYVRFIVAGDINLPQNHRAALSICYIVDSDIAQQRTQNALLRFHYNNGSANAPQCYITSIWPTL